MNVITKQEPVPRIYTSGYETVLLSNQKVIFMFLFQSPDCLLFKRTIVVVFHNFGYRSGFTQYQSESYHSL